ncbi:MCM-domain-containing protein [Linderina pennispora]|uniref:DNA helicase n=1 Tax=Linderina pennispora TaxID=61395 RepID=A0A1Y1WEL0_9FUNG|nr:MCM-domain-containing protein [Linderina pennispora]ORX71961.1 MCM-domain-containing protein [Linderina pennispora]
MSALAAISLGINYENEIGEISKFMQKFTTEGGKKTMEQDGDAEMAELSVGTSETKYMDILQAVADRKQDTISIALDDRFTHDKSLAFRIEHNAKTYEDPDADVLDRDQRDAAARRQQGEGAGGEEFPAVLTRRYTVQPAQAVLRGIVTRVSDVRPAMVVAAYLCDACGSEVFQECASARCTRGSRLVRFQEVKVQEQPDQVPMGDIPRTLSVHCYEGAVRQLNPGDVAVISGVFLPQPYTGFRALRAGLLADTLLEAHHYDQLASEATAEHDDVYGRVSRAIAPEIFGHDDVKKALLLLLVGAPAKRTGDGMAIRGDINVCLMGDPGVAKSQLLRFVSKAAPRGVYTTGRGSSGVGLTAAVTRDPVTGELVLEGGALVLADHGICAIDEFDKMDEGDRTAIHEVMEQQTISVAKAGITTTLNARTAILAAANPARSRYNPRLTPEENINLPAALLSRFDVLFLMLDRPNHDDDLQLARHVAHESDDEIDMDLLRLFVADARARTPSMPRTVADYVVGAYLSRDTSRGSIDTGMGGAQRSSIGSTTPRTLLGIVRLAQARARVRGQDQVGIEDVDEALRLMDAAQVTLDAQPGRAVRTDPVSAIFQIMARLARQGGPELRYNEVLERTGLAPVPEAVNLAQTKITFVAAVNE